jgi:CheY-like chemotaxis protein
MRQSAAVLCQDHSSLGTLKSAVERLGVNLIDCASQQQALEMVLSGECSTLIVDFDLPGAGEVIRMAALLPPEQKPALLALASRVWPGTGQVFQSGASRILYKPIDGEQVKEAVASGSKQSRKAGRKAARYEMKTLVYLELEGGTLPGIGIDISEHGLAVQAAEPVPISSNLAFRCVLPGTDFTLHGHAEVIWASDHGRAGLFFSRLAPAARKQLKQWLGKRGARAKSNDHDAVRALLPPADENVCSSNLE